VAAIDPGPAVSSATGPSPRLKAVLGVLMGLGALGFLGGLAAGSARATWGVFLINLLFWSGLAAAGPAIAGIFELTEARWAARLRRIATTTVAFMPVSFVLFVVLLLGMGVLYPWVAQPIPKKAVWLNVPFFVFRTVVGVGILYWLSVRFARAVHASPAGAAQEPGRAERARLAVGLLFAFVLVGSLFGYDLVMTLEPTWFSGLFGGYFVVTMLYSGFAFLVLLIAIRSFGRPGWEMPPTEMQDLAKLVFATSVLWMYFFFSQYLVIWYGNVPIETRYVVSRFFEDPWRTLAVIAFLIGWLIPFAYLLGRLTGRPPGQHRLLVTVACLALIAIFIERHVLVLPSVIAGAEHGGATTGLLDIVMPTMMSLGFGAAFVASYFVFVPRLGLTSRIEG
jgi:Ni/Fe-hydrogenase subunit HybB-like protein